MRCERPSFDEGPRVSNLTPKRWKPPHHIVGLPFRRSNVSREHHSRANLIPASPHLHHDLLFAVHQCGDGHPFKLAAITAKPPPVYQNTGQIRIVGCRRNQILGVGLTVYTNARATIQQNKFATTSATKRTSIQWRLLRPRALRSDRWRTRQLVDQRQVIVRARLRTVIPTESHSRL